MSKKVAVVSDSGAGWIQGRENLFYARFYVLFSDKSYHDGELTSEEYRQLYEDNKGKVSSSKPNKADFERAFKEAFDKGYDELIVVTVSSKVSGTYQSAVDASREFGDKKIHVMDSLSAIVPMGMLVDTILNLLDEKMEAQDVLEKVKLFPSKQFGGLFIGDIAHFVASGRIGKGKALLGTVLNLKPMFEGLGEEGIMGSWSKQRTMKGVYKEMTKKYLSYPLAGKKMYISVGIKNPQIKDEFLKYFNERVSGVEFMEIEMSQAMMSNSGYEFLGISFYKEKL